MDALALAETLPPALTCPCPATRFLEALPSSTVRTLNKHFPTYSAKKGQ